MTNFDILDNQFLSLSENELSDIDGGLAPLVIFGVGVGIALFMAGYTIGKDLRKKFGKSC
ncbi:class IIb bacteriocin, lactobin A/cerein 7B family [Streptococcus pneumoniae]|nr:class IIb bacteriocin, lactobin A/cerein 7B family [Streptococcus pneumoniae]MDG9600356.1 class IIb bacteriocin, lactobin A/cerein 7B family [Streptococcus pneumoniae]MDG9606281.1 class IIb bacteriocin, lactobin A/cerein 7B family [Streptococcus pneumoniae]